MKYIIPKIAAILYVVMLCTIFVDATSLPDVVIDGVPDNLLFNVSTSCSGHDYFYQATASDTGNFAILSRYTNIEEHQEWVFRLCYVDIYSADGSFLKELSFYTEQNCAIELIENSVVIYFFDKIVYYDYIADELHYFILDDENLLSASEFERLEQQKFAIGQWEYTCQKGFHGYTKLTRSNKSSTEVLFEGKGANYSVWNTLVPACLFSVALLFSSKLLKRRKG